MQIHLHEVTPLSAGATCLIGIVDIRSGFALGVFTLNAGQVVWC